MIGDVIYNICLENSALRELIGEQVGEQWYVRVSPMKVQQLEDTPAVFYQVLDNDPSDTKYGVSKLDSVRVQLTCYHEEYATVENVMDAVRRALDRFSGLIRSVQVQSIQFQNERDVYSEAGEVAGKQMDFKIRIEK